MFLNGQQRYSVQDSQVWNTGLGEAGKNLLR